MFFDLSLCVALFGERHVAPAFDWRDMIATINEDGRFCVKIPAEKDFQPLTASQLSEPVEIHDESVRHFSVLHVARRYPESRINVKPNVY
jgi:hypothetical protein